jgi:oxygen-dependent protoporphyrinogen oxidase
MSPPAGTAVAGGGRRPRAAVVGAGIAGLACAHGLTARGIDVVTYEGAPVAGGRMGTRRSGRLAFDHGASFLADCYEGVSRLAGDVGVPIQSAGRVLHVFLRNGRFHRMNLASFSDGLRMGGLSLATRLRAAAFGAWLCLRHPSLDFFDLSSATEEFDGESSHDLASRCVSREFADYVVDSFTSCMMFQRSTEISAAAVASLLRMMFSGVDFGVRYAAGGMGAVPEALSRQLTVRLSTPVRAVEREGDRLRLSTGGDSDLYDAVVLAVPAGEALRLLRNPSPAQRELLSGTSYSSTIIVGFQVPRSSMGGVHCAYVPWIENRIVSEFTNEAVKGGEYADGETAVINVGLHDESAAALLDRPDGEVFRIVGDELCRLLGLLSGRVPRLVPHGVMRWPCAIPRYTTGHVARVRRLLPAIQGHGGIFLCGDFTNAPWLEGACRSGGRAADSVARALAVPAGRPVSRPGR